MLIDRFDKPDLLKAVVDLINLASILEKEECHTATMKLLIVVAADALQIKKSND